MAMLDPDTMILLIIVIISVVIMAPLLIWLINLILKRKDRLSESPIDVHEMLYHKLKKAGKRNRRDLRIRRLINLGDEDYPCTDSGKIVGLIAARDSYHIFAKSGLLRRAQWYRVPVELCRDVYGRNLRIDCRGFRPHENYLVPIFCNNVDAKLRDYYEGVLDRDLDFLVLKEKNGELFEQNVNAMIESVSAKRRAPEIYNRDDHMSGQGGSTQQGEEQPSD